MQVAQSQANALLATQGSIGHGRPAGMTLTQQLLLLGYPLAGDLSLGGYRSENFVFGSSLTVQNAIEIWRGDEPHTATMLSQDHNDIGAGVTIGSDGTVYYVIDTALHTANGLPQSDAATQIANMGSGLGSDPQAALVSDYMVPVRVNTARPEGDVFHKVEYGQTLWSIAIEYHTKIKEIMALNHLGEDTTVYPGQLLLVMKSATQPPSAAPTYPASPTPRLTSTPTNIQPGFPTMTIAPFSTDSNQNDAPRSSSSGLWIGVVIFLAVVGGIAAALTIRAPKP